MDNVKFIDITLSDGTTRTFAIIDHGNNQFTSMEKSLYDAQQTNGGTE